MPAKGGIMSPIHNRVAFFFYDPLSKKNTDPARDAIKYSGWGFLYGLAIQTLLYPIEVVKLRQQDPFCNKRCDQVAQEIFREGRLKGFYSGLSSKLVETGHKHFWRWPLIMQLPPLLEGYAYNENQQQALTGLTIGMIDAFFSTPWDTLKLAAIYKLQKKISWHGFPTFLAKRIVEWTSFLVAQNHFSKRQQREKKTLNLTQSFILALQTTACVSFAKAPFDVANTLRKTGKSLPLKNISPWELLRRMYRGTPLSFSALLIYNFSTTIFKNRLKHSF